MRKNYLKEKLKQGKFVLGVFVNCAYPAFVEVCGYAGFEFVVIDLEHSPLHVLAAEDLCRAADCVEMAAMVRVRKNDASQIQRALDIGSAGVQVPQIETALEAQGVVNAAKYSPIGSRGLSFNTRAGNYTAAGTDITNRLNDQSLVVIHVEGTRGVENLPEIVQVPHIDVIFLGPYDLSQSLGIPGQVNDPRVVDLMKESIALIRSAGKAAGTFADTPERAKFWKAAGVQYVTLGVDVAIFLQACRQLVEAVNI